MNQSQVGKPKDIALVIMISAIAFVFGVVAVGLTIGMINNPQGITITGSIDLNQFVGIIIGVAVAGVAFVGQQLTAKHGAKVQQQTDQAWLDDQAKQSGQKPPGQ